MMTEKQTWLHMAEECLKVTKMADNANEVFLGSDLSVGLCHMVRSMWMDEKIDFKVVHDISLKIYGAISTRRMGRVFLFPCTEEGAKQRREFCLSQAALCYEQASGG